MEKEQKEGQKRYLNKFCFPHGRENGESYFPHSALPMALGIQQRYLIRPLYGPVRCKILFWKPWGHLELESVPKVSTIQTPSSQTLPKDLWPPKDNSKSLHTLSPDSWGGVGVLQTELLQSLEPQKELWSLDMSSEGWCGKKDGGAPNHSISTTVL